MRTSLILACGLSAAVLSSSPVLAQSKADQSFIKEAIQANLGEIQIGQLAQQKGNSDGVRSFGKMLTTDHSENNTKATQAAQSLNVTPPTTPSAEGKKTYDKLAKLSGPAFDRAFAKDMVADHKKDIKKFEKEAKSKDQTVAQYANDTLPALHKHLEAAQSLNKGAK